MSSLFQQVVRDTGIRVSKDPSDTIRIWENYREQAKLWRALALVQIPGIFFLTVFALFLWFSQSIVLNVPEKPLPGIYPANQISDAQYIDQSTKYLNLVGTYQPAVARRQFEEARKYLGGEMLDKFDKEIMTTEVKTVESSSLTQVFFIDPTRTKVERTGEGATVTLRGDRFKSIAGKEVNPVTTEFKIKLEIIPNNTFNPYGIVISDVRYTNMKAAGESDN